MPHKACPLHLWTEISMETHVCTLLCVLLLLRKEKKLQAWDVSHIFRIKMRNYDPVWQGLSDSRMSIKASSQTQYVPGSRARFLKLSKALSLSNRHNQPSSLSRGRSTYNLENTKQGIASRMVWKKAECLSRWPHVLFAAWESFSYLFRTSLPWEVFAGILT